MLVGELLDQCEQLVGKGLSFIKQATDVDGKVATAKLDDHQQAIYDLSVSYAEVKSAQQFLLFATDHGAHEQDLSNLFSAEAISNVLSRLRRAPSDMGLVPDDFEIEKSAFEYIGSQLEKNVLRRLGARRNTE